VERGEGAMIGYFNKALLDNYHQIEQGLFRGAGAYFQKRTTICVYRIKLTVLFLPIFACFCLKMCTFLNSFNKYIVKIIVS